MASKNLLMVCYYFPPLTDVGCKRSVAFATYLKKEGWSPYALSVKNPDRHYCSLGTDAPPDGVPAVYTRSLVNPIKFLGKANGLVDRVLSLFNRGVSRNYFYEFLCIPDFFVGWVPLTVVRAVKLIRAHNIETVYVSCSPFSAALIGVACRRLTGRRLVLDFRDPFGLTLEGSKASRTKERIDAFFARLFLKHTDLLIVTTDETRREYAAQFPQFKEKVVTVHNGFDATHLVTDQPEKFHRFTIIYTGQFYYKFNPSLNMYADNFFSALAQLKKENRICSETFQFLFYGSEQGAIRDYAARFGVEDLVTVNGRVSHAEVLLAMRRSHLQLLRIMKLMLSTKLFEGIPMNIPFLATIPPGEAEEIIRRYSPGSYVITEDSAEKIKGAIVDAMDRYAKGPLPDNHVEEFMDCFSREALTQKLMGHLTPDIS
ncbi:glycosyltransferase [Desulfoluna butyratoxydans]|uniref:glycosyltransferase n=1 Tax=Desulfoluna butyratoxydans TaxID=231438 RepID=UPI0015D3E02A|nr:glycosyltransferase [Desulfoluna butyratoxydans]